MESVAAAMAQATAARNKYERFSTLLVKGAVSQQEVDELEADWPNHTVLYRTVQYCTYSTVLCLIYSAVLYRTGTVLSTQYRTVQYSTYCTVRFSTINYVNFTTMRGVGVWNLRACSAPYRYSNHPGRPCIRGTTSIGSARTRKNFLSEIQEFLPTG